MVSSLFAITIFSCSKSDSIANANKNEFGSIHHIDSIIGATFGGGWTIYISNGEIDSSYEIPDTTYYYFQYNSDGLPVSRSGGWIQFPRITGYSYFWVTRLKDTLIYLNNHTIEINTFSEDPQYNYNKKALCIFSKGYIIQRIDLQSNGFNDTTTFTYNASHQLISTLYFDNEYSATKTNYTYSNDTTTGITYDIDRTTGERSHSYTSTSSWWSTGTGPNPYYKQEWLKMWPELVDKTLSPYN